jgi:hypothetical protein
VATEHRRDFLLDAWCRLRLPLGSPRGRRLPWLRSSRFAVQRVVSHDVDASPATVFLLSPARCNSERANQLLTSKRSALGQQLRAHAATIGEVFAWLSALYFRGKLTYARRFGHALGGLPGVLIMAPGLGLRASEALLSAAMLRAMGEVEVESAAFVQPLARDARLVAHLCGPTARVVLLGSIATGKYLDTLLDVFGAQLLFPETFVGRGDMSRGGLLLRAARCGEELAYRPVVGATLHGTRPPKLPRLHDDSEAR